jgi:hypothetical protein
VHIEGIYVPLRIVSASNQDVSILYATTVLLSVLIVNIHKAKISIGKRPVELAATQELGNCYDS